MSTTNEFKATMDRKRDERTATVPEGERTPFTPPPGPNSSFVFRASSWSTVMRAEAAN